MLKQMTLRIENIEHLELFGDSISDIWYDQDEIKYYDVKKIRRKFYSELKKKDLPIDSKIYFVQEFWGGVYEIEYRLKAHWVAISNKKISSFYWENIHISGLYIVLSLDYSERKSEIFWQDFDDETLPRYFLEHDFDRPSFQVFDYKNIKNLKDTNMEYYFAVKPSCSGLDYRLRSIAAMSSLLSQGRRMDELRIRMELALETGFTLSDLKEIILQICLYAGFPRSLNGMSCLQTLMENRNQRGQKTVEGTSPSPPPEGVSRYHLGWDKLQSLDSEFIHRLKAGLDQISPDLFSLILEHAYADIFYRDNLDIRQREVAVVAALVAVGNVDPQLSFHIMAALGTGIDRLQMSAIINVAAMAAGKNPNHALGLIAKVPK
jgi:4-carboxymuconolactone decarboxylase